MKANLYKKSLAIALSAAMVAGGSMTAFASGVSTATGTGESTGHLNTDIVEATLPLESAVAGVFDYTVDPERLIDKAGKLADGTTAVTKNDDGVYFKTGDTTYAAKSKEIEIEVKNYVKADVSVNVAVEENEKNIALASAAEDLTGATDPLLLLKLNVGDQNDFVTADGATVTKEVDEQEANFNVVGKGTSYELEAKSDATWTKVKFSLEGKINNVNVSDDAVAPKLTLTWEVKKHVDGPVATPGSMSTAAKSATISNLGEGVTLSSVQIIKTDNTGVSLAASSHYTFANGTFAIINGKEALLNASTYSKFVLTFSDSSVVNIPIVAAE